MYNGSQVDRLIDFFIILEAQYELLDKKYNVFT